MSPPGSKSSWLLVSGSDGKYKSIPTYGSLMESGTDRVSLKSNDKFEESDSASLEIISGSKSSDYNVTETPLDFNIYGTPSEYDLSDTSLSGSLDEPDVVYDINGIRLQNSLYPEVRAAVPLKDDYTIKLNHWRTWALTSFFVILFAAVNQFFSVRFPSLSVGFIVAQLASYPVGFALSMLPNYQPFRKSSVNLQTHENSWRSWFDLNPGSYSIKEHATLTICVSLTASSAYAMNMLITQTNFYFQDYSICYELLLVLTSQMLGYGVAGLTRRWVVYPGSMIWPETLVSTTLFTTIHGGKTKSIANGWTMSRYKFFGIIMTASFLWYWLPGFLFTGLSYFTVVCWIFPKNKVVNQLFGYRSGLGLLPITFDWVQITAAGSSPLATPFWVTANIFAAVVLFFWVLVPILYYNNVWHSKYLPMLSGTTFDNTAKPYNVSRVLSKDLVLDEQAYQNYSPLMIPFSYTISYALNFAAVTAVFVHCALYHGKDIMQKLKDAKHGEEDVHKKLMARYREVPDLWYLILFLIVFVLSILVVMMYDTQLPVWGLLVSIAISLINFLPQGLLEAITNQHVGLNIITELIGGYMFPGKPIANLMVKLYGFIPMRQGLDFSRDLKLAQYMKVPPVLLFWMQIYSTVLAALVNVGVQRWMRLNIPDFCSPNQVNGFVCANGRTIFNASIIWGAVGPAKMFSPGKMYNAVLWFFLVGVIAPFITFKLHHKFPKRWFGKLNAPVFFTGPGNIPPATGVNYAASAIIGFVFNYAIKKKWRPWWTKYNYVLSAALDSGVAVASIVIFLTVTYPGGQLNWWGNNVWKNTLDYTSTKFYSLAPGETFGPAIW